MRDRYMKRGGPRNVYIELNGNSLLLPTRIIFVGTM